VVDCWDTATYRAAMPCHRAGSSAGAFDAGIPHRGRGKGPRLHDLRHSFAVHILNKWSSEGKDIYTCLPILRTALGHDRITTTEKYLRLVPEAYMEVTEPFNERFHTITEVLCNEE